MEIYTGQEIDPNQIVEHRTDIAEKYNVSNSFADECIAKLLLDMPLGELKKRTTFRGLNPLAERSVLVALQRRYKFLKSV